MIVGMTGRPGGGLAGGLGLGVLVRVAALALTGLTDLAIVTGGNLAARCRTFFFVIRTVITITVDIFKDTLTRGFLFTVVLFDRRLFFMFIFFLGTLCFLFQFGLATFRFRGWTSWFSLDGGQFWNGSSESHS